MKFVIQRVLNAKVDVENKTIGSIEKGLLVLVGISANDNEEIADKYIKKLVNLRIFEDTDGKTNLSLKDVNGALLLVSQFTLYADCKKGNRPSFTSAAKPEHANFLFEYIVKECKKEIEIVESGIFGADMKVSLLNDGPFTVILDI